MSNTSLTSKELVGKKYKSVLCLSDQHFPYEHPDLIPFLKDLDKKYNFDLVINMGDEVDKHGLSYHEKEPELPNYERELDKAILQMQPLYKLFPSAIVLDSNHGSLILRKGKTSGLPNRVFRLPGDILQAPRGWMWHRDVVFTTELGKVYCHHGKTSQAGKLSKNMGMNTVQAHYHSNFYVTYWGSPIGLFWDMNVGCVVDDKSLAMAYNKVTLSRPVIGVGIILNGRPVLVPMHLDRRGRWTGRL